MYRWEFAASEVSCLLLEDHSANITPAGTEQRAAWRVGHYRKLSHMRPFSKSNKLSIFSRKVGNLWVHVIPRKEGQTAPDIPLMACSRWNCDENKESFTHQNLDFPVPQ